MFVSKSKFELFTDNARMLEDDLKLSSSEDSDGEQDSAKNASRNTSQGR